MPELIEVEAYRALAQEAALGRRVTGVDAPDPWYLKGGLQARDLEVLIGRRLVEARRVGKLLLLRASVEGCGPGAPLLGLRFGMTGRLLVDGIGAAGDLLYSPQQPGRAYDRFGLRFDDGGSLVVRDPRRLGGVELGPHWERLGPDASGVTLDQLRSALAGGRGALKARLTDQARLAGVGNLIADEVLWRAGLRPGRPSGSLEEAELRRLHRHLGEGVRTMTGRGGSHTGDLMAQRRPGGRCPVDGAELQRARVAGRTTWWCPLHQR